MFKNYKADINTLNLLRTFVHLYPKTGYFSINMNDYNMVTTFNIAHKNIEYIFMVIVEPGDFVVPDSKEFTF